MKLITVIFLMMASFNTFASKAKVEALGQRSWGSNYIESDRLTFINPANLMDFNNYVVAEWGSQNSTVAAQSDKEGQENGEGGVFVKDGQFNYGVYLGNESNDAYILKAMSGISAVTRPMLNRVEVYVAKEQRFKTGLGLWVAHGSDEQSVTAKSITQTSLGIKLGIKDKKFRAGLVQGILEKNKGTTSSTIGYEAEFNGKFMSMLNGGYDLSDRLSLIGEFIRVAGEVEKSTPENLNGKLTLDNHFVGVGYKIHQKEGVNIYTDLTFRYINFNFDTTAHRQAVQNVVGNLDTALAASELAGTQVYVPLNIAAEVNATSWMAFRGAITQRLWGYDKEVSGDKITKKKGRIITAGMGLKFKNLDIDGLIQDRENAQLGSNDIISRVAATYYW